MLVKLNSKFFTKCRAPASFRLAKKFGEINSRSSKDPFVAICQHQNTCTCLPHYFARQFSLTCELYENHEKQTYYKAGNSILFFYFCAFLSSLIAILPKLQIQIENNDK